jgi:hypothetical protein
MYTNEKIINDNYDNINHLNNNTKKNHINIKKSNLHASSQSEKKNSVPNNSEAKEKIKNELYKSDNKSKTFYNHKSKEKTLMLSKGNVSCSEFAKFNRRKQIYNINRNNTNNEFHFLNKYHPGYIYYKEYQNIIEKLNKKKIQSGKAFIKKSKDNKLYISQKRFKSGNIKTILQPKNTYNNNNLYISNNNNSTNLPNIKKNNDMINENTNNILAKSLKTRFLKKKSNNNIYANINNKDNPYSIHWASKLLSFNDVYLGVNYYSNSSVPLLKTLNGNFRNFDEIYNKEQCKCNEKSLKNTINRNKKSKKFRINVIKKKNKKDTYEEQVMKKYNTIFINDNNNKYIENDIINKNSKIIYINKNNNEIKKKSLKEEKNINNDTNINNENIIDSEERKIKDNSIDFINKIVDDKFNENNVDLNKKENEEDEEIKQKEIFDAAYDFTNSIIDGAKTELKNDSKKKKGKKIKESTKEDKNEGVKNKNNIKKKCYKNIVEEPKDPLEYIKMFNERGNLVEKEETYEENKKGEDEENQKFKKIFDNNLDNDEIEEDNLSINEELEKQFNTNQKNFFKFRKDIKEVPENLEDDDENNNN